MSIDLPPRYHLSGKRGYHGTHRSLDTSDASLIDELEIHLTSLVYCWGVYNKLVAIEPLFKSDADDIELNDFSQGYHIHCHIHRITSHHARPMFTAPGPPPVDNVCNKNIALLAASLTQVVGDQYKSAAILKRMHEHTIKKDREKKEKSKDWHEVTKKVILHAASVDGHTPETNIPTTLRAFVNARSIGAAEAPNTELANQMRIMGLEEVGWHISFTHNLGNGQVIYIQVGVPSNLSIFLLRLNDPTRLNKQQAKGMEVVHLIDQHIQPASRCPQILFNQLPAGCWEKALIAPATCHNKPNTILGWWYQDSSNTAWWLVVVSR